jgi:hypothetical protein
MGSPKETDTYADLAEAHNIRELKQITRHDVFILPSSKICIVLSQQNTFGYVKPAAYVGEWRDGDFAHSITTPHKNQPNIIYFNRGGV